MLIQVNEICTVYERVALLCFITSVTVINSFAKFMSCLCLNVKYTGKEIVLTRIKSQPVKST